ncbi:MAG: hypothetical protein K0R83_2629, partial [Caulobacter sp.]|nr:hypothetical protein [Caulobacter sp.]
MSQPTPQEIQQEAEIAAWLGARADRIIETSCA